MSTSTIRVRRVLAWTAGALLAAAPAAAQIGEPVDEDRECTCIESLREHADGLRIHADEVRVQTEGLRERMEEMREQVQLRAVSAVGRARLGVMLGANVEENGRSGVVLEDVMEGSPAHRAGLRAADVVVSVNETAFGEDAAEDVLAVMAEVEPGDTVQVTFLRDGEQRTVQVVTEETARFRFFAPGMAPDAPGPPHRFYSPAAPGAPRAPGAPQEVIVRQLRMAGFDQHGLELAAVNADLGQYFGTERGVLVTAVDEDSSLHLQAGDVILAIGGRDAHDPAHVRAILASYRSDEDVRLQVVREHRTIDVTGRP